MFWLYIIPFMLWGTSATPSHLPKYTVEELTELFANGGQKRWLYYENYDPTKKGPHPFVITEFRKPDKLLKFDRPNTKPEELKWRVTVVENKELETAIHYLILTETLADGRPKDHSFYIKRDGGRVILTSGAISSYKPKIRNDLVIYK